MGKVWSVDAVAKNASTSFYGNIVSLTESPLQEDLIWIGTDDGLIQFTRDGGTTWQRLDSLPDVPEMTYVSDLGTSHFAPGTVYAAFDNHKKGDFLPYLFKTTDFGRTWTSLTANLPERGSVHTVAEDHVDPRLLFVGTEFGLFFSSDGGTHWVQLEEGLPPIAVRDLALQQRENDLIAGTFGRGIFILDDYSCLRGLNEDALAQEALLFPTRRSWMYFQDTPLGTRGKGFQGDSFFTAPNPPFGAVITYYLRDEVKSRKALRQAEEKRAQEAGEEIAYPDWEALRAEDTEDKPSVLLIVSDNDGNTIRTLEGSTKPGLHRLAWDFRFPPSTPVDLSPDDPGPFSDRPHGPMVAPATFQIVLGKRVDGQYTQLAGPVQLVAESLGTASLPTEDRQLLLEFQQKTARLQRAILGAGGTLREAENRLKHLKQAVLDTPAADPSLYQRTVELEEQLFGLRTRLTGDRVRSSRNAPVPPSMTRRIQGIVAGHWASSSAPTNTQREAYEIAAQDFAILLQEIRQFVEQDLGDLENELEGMGAPWTPGRIPRWEPE
jgi:hypothetical protein